MGRRRDALARHYRRALVACCVLLAFTLRSADLVSDPPSDLEDSGGYFADEGFWTHNARNKVVFGSWSLDEWNNMYASPLTHWPQYLSFRLMGVGLVQARIVPAVLSAACCALVAALPGAAGILAALLFALDPLLLHFGRIALLETPVIFLLLVSWASLAGRPRRGLLVLAGLSAGLAAATKLTVGYFVPAAFLSLILAPPPPGRWRSVLWFAAGLAAAGAAWVLMVGRGMPLFLQYARFYASQQSPWVGSLLSNLRSPVLFHRFRHSLPLAAAGFALASALVPPSLRSRLPRPVMLACLWCVSGALYLTTLTYDPLRYYMPLLPAFVVLVAWAVVQAWRGRLHLAPYPLGLLLCVMFLWPMAWGALLDLRPHAVHCHRWRMAVVGVATLAGLAAGWLVVLRLLRHRTGSRVMAVAVVVVCIVTSCRAYAGWVTTRQRAVFTASRELGRRFPPSVFTGQWGPELCLENGHRAVPVWPGFVNGQGDPFGVYGITHGVIWGRHWAQYAAWFPDEFARARILDTLWIKDTPVVLCEFPHRASPTPDETVAAGAQTPGAQPAP